MRFLPVFSFACILFVQLAPKALAFESRFGKKIDLDILEADMMENEEPDDNAAFKMERGEDGKLHPTGQELMPKPEMLFAELKAEYDTKEKVEEVAEKWTTLLFTNGLQVRPYPIDDNRLLFVVNTGMYDTEEFKQFALNQEETKVIEYKQQKYYPGDSKDNKGPNGVDMKRVQEILAKQGISLNGMPGANKKKGRKKRKGKTKRQKREEKRKRKEANKKAKQKDAKDDL
mmetsp:Transcript_11944/g.19138  ORF Transcript_11944/g.19138 Transcript_11944/m.19138 type:complete len:230 (-) Transcript_11944:51-740(-)